MSAVPTSQSGNLFSDADYGLAEWEAETIRLLRGKQMPVHVYEPSAAYPAKERIRHALLDGQAEHVVRGRPPGGKGCETFQQSFERVYGEPLTRKSTSPGYKGKRK